MNERIRELVKQSGGDFWQRLENDAVKENAYITFDPPESLEKFVELIVKETLEVARAGVEFGDGMESAVEQYFGVKL
jgi:hypothetical protein